MSVKLELYKVFKEVAEAGNITAAAQSLYISQSAVSQSVKQLENELQTRLFSRNSRGVSLTGEGRMLYEYVRSAMGLLETGEAKLSQTRELQMGQLTIGASDTVTSQFLLPYLDRFHRRYPAIHIQIISGRSHKVLGLLQSGKVDVAFASTPAESNSLRTYPCFSTHAIFVAGAEYPCDFDHVYSLEEIARFPLILLERKASSRLYLEKYFLQNGLHLDPEIELGARSLLVDLASIGFGVAGVTEEFVTRELADGRLRKLKTSFEIPPRSVDMCALRDVPLSAAAQQFVSFVQENLTGQTP
ncbi:MAG: LysR family transcriptional regulator [Ruminococcaceae bacterium]|jgi:DNA-binding transcriptional LysR family regulator|nr:LysR family transcriptional regulator [Oscillospiraceae bacterium]